MARKQGVSDALFPGAKKKFRYYDRKGGEHFIYTSGKPPKKKNIFLFLISMFIYLWLIFLLGFGCINSVVESGAPKPLIPEYQKPDVRIEDTIHVIEDKDSLEKAMRDFEDLTGISPYILTVHHSDWEKYNGIAAYASEVYIDYFSDGQHLLIIYSEPDIAEEESTGSSEETDLSAPEWWLLKGRQTKDILYKNNSSAIFEAALREYLMDESVSVGEAFRKTFAESLGYVMDTPEEAKYVWIYVSVFVGFILMIVLLMIGSIDVFAKSRRKYEEVPMNADDLRILSDTKKWLIDHGVRIRGADYEAGRDSMEDRYGEVNGYDINGYVLNGEYVDKDKRS